MCHYISIRKHRSGRVVVVAVGPCQGRVFENGTPDPTRATTTTTGMGRSVPAHVRVESCFMCVWSVTRCVAPNVRPSLHPCDLHDHDYYFLHLPHLTLEPEAWAWAVAPGYRLTRTRRSGVSVFSPRVLESGRNRGDFRSRT